MRKQLTRSVFVFISAGILSLSVLAQQKNYKDRGEFESYDAVAKDLAAKNFAKAILDLESWSKKYPVSDFQNDRQLLYVLAYSETNQPAKALDTANTLLSDVNAAFPQPADALRLLYAAVAAIRRLPDPSEAQIAAAGNAARQLSNYDRMPEGVTAEAWSRTRTELQTAANAAAVYIAIVPVGRALKTNDCTAAEEAALRAVNSFPKSAQAAWNLSAAELCLYKTHPEKASFALYELARAATIDASTELVDPAWQRSTVEPFLENIYTQYHGKDPDGLRALKETAAKSPLPSREFSIPSAAQIAKDSQEQFERDNPEIALWMKIKQALDASDGPEYFASGLKDASVPPLVGVIISVKPECRPTELLVAPRTSGSAQPRPQVTLKLSKALSGKPLNGEIRWQGTPVVFVQNPFMLTMETEIANIDGLKIEPCAPASPRRATGAK